MAAKRLKCKLSITLHGVDYFTNQTEVGLFLLNSLNKFFLHEFLSSCFPNSRCFSTGSHDSKLLMSPRSATGFPFLRLVCFSLRLFHSFSNFQRTKLFNRPLENPWIAFAARHSAPTTQSCYGKSSSTLANFKNCCFVFSFIITTTSPTAIAAIFFRFAFLWTFHVNTISTLAASDLRNLVYLQVFDHTLILGW